MPYYVDDFGRRSHYDNEPEGESLLSRLLTSLSDSDSSTFHRDLEEMDKREDDETDRLKELLDISRRPVEEILADYSSHELSKILKDMESNEVEIPEGLADGVQAKAEAEASSSVGEGGGDPIVGDGSGQVPVAKTPPVIFGTDNGTPWWILNDVINAGIYGNTPQVSRPPVQQGPTTETETAPPVVMAEPQEYKTRRGGPHEVVFNDGEKDFTLPDGTVPLVGEPVDENPDAGGGGGGSTGSGQSNADNSSTGGNQGGDGSFSDPVGGDADPNAPANDEPYIGGRKISDIIEEIKKDPNLTQAQKDQLIIIYSNPEGIPEGVPDGEGDNPSGPDAEDTGEEGNGEEDDTDVFINIGDILRDKDDDVTIPTNTEDDSEPGEVDGGIGDGETPNPSGDPGNQNPDDGSGDGNFDSGGGESIDPTGDGGGAGTGGGDGSGDGLGENDGTGDGTGGGNGDGDGPGNGPGDGEGQPPGPNDEPENPALTPVIPPPPTEEPPPPISIRGFFGFSKTAVEDEYRRNLWTLGR